MKKKALIFSNKGETLVESIISILVFSVLMVTIAITIQAALRITGLSADAANQAQETVNTTIEGVYINPANVTFTFNYEIITAEPPAVPPDTTITITEQIHINNVPGNLAFRLN